MSVLAFIGLLYMVVRSPLAADEAQVGSWNLPALKQIPAMRWIDRHGPIHSLLYSGEDYKGQTTQVSAPEVSGGLVKAAFASPLPIKFAALHYTSDQELRFGRTWHSLAATIRERQIVAPQPPASANTWFVTLADDRDAMVSSGVQFSRP